MKYKQRSKTVDAFQWTGDQNQTEDPLWIIAAIKTGQVTFRKSNIYPDEVCMVIWNKLRTQHITVSVGDYVYITEDGVIKSFPQELFHAYYEVDNDKP